MPRRRKPHDPALAARALAEREEREAEKARLQAQGATVKTDRAGRVVAAYRSNVFNLLLGRGTITQDHYSASEWLSTLWAEWKGLDGKADRLAEVVDGAGGSRELVTDRMIRAGREVHRVLDALQPLSRLILEHFMVAAVEEDRPMSWRGIMERIGIWTLERQTVAVVLALEELRAYRQGDARVAA